MAVVRVFLALLLMVYTSYAYADEPQEPTPASSAETELIALDNAWIEAEFSGDRVALERILHEDFLVTYPSGQTVDRTTFIDGILQNRPAPFTVTHEFIRVYDNIAVIVDVSEDLSESGKFKFTWIAVKLDNQWRVVSETVSTIESH